LLVLAYLVPALRTVNALGSRHPALATALVLGAVLGLISLADLFEAVRKLHGTRGVVRTALLGAFSAAITGVLLLPLPELPRVARPVTIGVAALGAVCVVLGVVAQRHSPTRHLGLRGVLLGSVELYGTLILGGGAVMTVADFALREWVGVRVGCPTPGPVGQPSRPSIFDCGKTATEFAANVVDQLTVAAAAFVLVLVVGLATGAAAYRCWMLPVALWPKRVRRYLASH
jgi:hypothetical protein